MFSVLDFGVHYNFSTSGIWRLTVHFVSTIFIFCDYFVFVFCVAVSFNSHFGIRYHKTHRLIPMVLRHSVDQSSVHFLRSYENVLCIVDCLLPICGLLCYTIMWFFYFFFFIIFFVSVFSLPCAIAKCTWRMRLSPKDESANKNGYNMHASFHYMYIWNSFNHNHTQFNIAILGIHIRYKTHQIPQINNIQIYSTNFWSKRMQKVAAEMNKLWEH